jgi:hypothetical protein
MLHGGLALAHAVGALQLGLLHIMCLRAPIESVGFVHSAAIIISCVG